MRRRCCASIPRHPEQPQTSRRSLRVAGEGVAKSSQTFLFGNVRLSERGVGKPGFPTPPPAGGSGRAQPSSRGMGKPGFPIRSPGGRVWEGVALPGQPFLSHCGCGLEARAPGPPPAGGSGRATPSQEQLFLIGRCAARRHGRLGYEGTNSPRAPVSRLLQADANCVWNV